MTVTNQTLVIQITISMPENQTQPLLTAIQTSIQSILTAHGIGGALIVGGNYSETISP